MRGGRLPHGITDDFGVHWIEAGHRMREQIADDALLIRLLRLALPPYEGESAILFRGENFVRWQAGIVGLAWTPQVDVARMFASGLNAVGTGGVLFAAKFQPSAIVSGPNGHSGYLGEEQFTVNSQHAEDLQVLELFPPT